MLKYGFCYRNGTYKKDEYADYLEPISKRIKVNFTANALKKKLRDETTFCKLCTIPLAVTKQSTSKQEAFYNFDFITTEHRPVSAQQKSRYNCQFFFFQD